MHTNSRSLSLTHTHTHTQTHTQKHKRTHISARTRDPMSLVKVKTTSLSNSAHVRSHMARSHAIRRAVFAHEIRGGQTRLNGHAPPSHFDKLIFHREKERKRGREGERMKEREREREREKKERKREREKERTRDSERTWKASRNRLIDQSIEQIHMLSTAGRSFRRRTGRAGRRYRRGCRWRTSHRAASAFVWPHLNPRFAGQ